MTDLQKMHNGLVEAYKGHYDDDTYLEQDDKSFKSRADMSAEEYDTWVRWKILRDEPKERLERYLEWNGIFGYATTAYHIATGGL